MWMVNIVGGEHDNQNRSMSKIMRSSGDIEDVMWRNVGNTDNVGPVAIQCPA
jgi:hypothetical protein